MPVYRANKQTIEALPRTSFEEEGWNERSDIQRLLRDRIEVLRTSPADREIYVVAEEYGDWDGSTNRIDLLAVDQDARLVVIELKRTRDGGPMELQALRYAAMISEMDFDQLVRAHTKYLSDRKLPGDARSMLLSFLQINEDEEEPSLSPDRPRILLVSGGFSPELITTVLWLHEADIDLRCVRLQPYGSGQELIFEVTQVAPTPELDVVRVSSESKQRAEKQAYPAIPWTSPDVEKLKQIVANPAANALLDLLSANPDEWIPFAAVVDESGQLVMQARGGVAGLTMTVQRKCGRGNLPFETKWAAGGEQQMYYKMTPEIATWWKSASPIKFITPEDVYPGG